MIHHVFYTFEIENVYSHQRDVSQILRPLWVNNSTLSREEDDRDPRLMLLFI